MDGKRAEERADRWEQSIQAGGMLILGRKNHWLCWFDYLDSSLDSRT
jgi:hypothetical protein